MKGLKLARRTTRGVPQGGILSPLMWNVLFDEFLKLYQEGLVSCEGFADDALLLTSGHSLGFMLIQMQSALDKATNWAESVGLTLSPSKTLAVIFTRRKLPNARSYNKLRLGFKEIGFVTTARYLGVLLDSKLTYNAHINARIAKCKKLLMMLRRVIANSWGPRPQFMDWAWHAIARTALSYGCFVWGHAATKFKVKLRSLQRLALIQYGNFRQGTPSEGLEVITGNPPLDLFIQSQVVSAYVRLWDRLPRSWEESAEHIVQPGHISYAKHLAEEFQIPHPRASDRLSRPQYITKRKFRVVTESFATGKVVSKHILHCYTDGSKLESSHTGIGVAIVPPDHLRDPDTMPQIVSRYIGTDASVFQAEVLAILEACYHLFNYLQAHPKIPRTVIMYIDNQAALQALNADAVTSKTVEQCISSLSTLGLSTRLYLRYVKAHVGNVGNEMADKAAKLASSRPTPFTRPLTFIPLCSYRTSIHYALLRLWNARWHRSTVSQTKIWFPVVSPRRSRYLLTQPRKVFSRFVRFVTGHCFLRYQRALVADLPLSNIAPLNPAHTHAISPASSDSPVASPASLQLTPPPAVGTASPDSLELARQYNPAIVCRLCHRHKERAVEIITTCEYLWDLRLRTFGSFTLSAITPQWTPRELLCFLADPRIAELEKDES